MAADVVAAPIRLLMVGCGSISGKHVEAIMAVTPRAFVITAVADPNASACAKFADEIERLELGPTGAADSCGVRQFGSLTEAIEADPTQVLFEAVDLMVPSIGTLHEVLAIEAMIADRHVLLEKPIAVDVASGERILAFKAEQGDARVLMVAENSQYWPEVLEAVAMIEAGTIGEVLTARAKYWESAHPALNEWATCYEPGTFYCTQHEGFVFDGGLHWLRPLRMFMGKVTKVVGTTGRSLAHMKGASIASAILKFASGKTAVFESVLAPGAISDQPFFTVQGTLGEITINGFDGGGHVCTVAPDGTSTTTVAIDKVGWDAGYAGEFADFAMAVRTGTAPAAGAQEAQDDLRVMLAIVQSAATERWVAVDAVDPTASCSVYPCGAAGPAPTVQRIK